MLRFVQGKSEKGINTHRASRYRERENEYENQVYDRVFGFEIHRTHNVYFIFAFCCARSLF